MYYNLLSDRKTQLNCEIIRTRNELDRIKRAIDKGEGDINTLCREENILSAKLCELIAEYNLPTYNSINDLDNLSGHKDFPGESGNDGFSSEGF